MVWIQTHLLSAYWISDAQPHPNTSQLIRDKQAEPSGTAHTPERWAGLQPCSQAGIWTPAELAFPFLLSCIDLRKNWKPVEKVWESAQHTNLCIIYGLKGAWTPSNKEKMIESLGTATEFNCNSRLTVQECLGGEWGEGVPMGLEKPREQKPEPHFFRLLLFKPWDGGSTSIQGSSGELTGRNECMGFKIATKACWGKLCEGAPVQLANFLSQNGYLLQPKAPWEEAERAKTPFLDLVIGGVGVRAP